MDLWYKATFKSKIWIYSFVINIVTVLIIAHMMHEDDFLEKKFIFQAKIKNARIQFDLLTNLRFIQLFSSRSIGVLDTSWKRSNFAAELSSVLKFWKLAFCVCVYAIIINMLEG